MLTSIKQRLGHDDEQGFTLIELMVVVLIIAILLAIAIPTFLGARNSANARSMQSNLRNALTAEDTNWTNSQSFVQTAATFEPSLNWSATVPAAKGGNTVFATIEDTTGTLSSGVILEGWAADGNCYAIYQSDDPAYSFTAYTAYKGACLAVIAGEVVVASPALATGNGFIAATQAAAVWESTW